MTPGPGIEHGTHWWETSALITAPSLLLFRCKFSFHEKLFDLVIVPWFFWTNHNSLLRIATNEITSFCIGNKLHLFFFFVFAKVGKGRLSSNWERFWNWKSVVVCFFAIEYIDDHTFESQRQTLSIKNLFFTLLYKANRCHISMRPFSNRSQRASKCGKNISDTLGYRFVCHSTFCSKLCLAIFSFRLCCLA